MKNNTFNKYEIEDLEFALEEFLKVNNIIISKRKCVEVKNFNELTELIIDNIDLENTDDCTSQDVFYKLKKIITNYFKISEDITPKTNLEKLVPIAMRRKLVKTIDKELGFKTNILKPPNFVSIALIIIFICSLIYLFFDFWNGLLLSIIIFCIINLVSKFGFCFRSKTLGEITKKIVTENYMKLRSKKETVNKNEFRAVILEWFSDRMDMKKHELENVTFN
ncbi:hypothetical protein SAMN05660477_03135 [Soonwooa buanensis]|uniref:Uncharacterized protein n=1 Tax=Soonwooa buanensis TaxID=619805 RepID=A0A1T5GTZ2_9FLAO|nr:hypothetical protein [Soonwooa buanensis]SKC11881.1 hypothetical protein SAMN05660477_03135 [Soonwooa buanensis]